MSATQFDVAGRLAAGREAVERTQAYVTACQRLGYQQPDLTGYVGQVRDWYAGEDGLDLQLLDRDCAALRAAADAVEQALQAQRAQVGQVAAAWRGGGGESTAQFLQRHCDSGAELVVGLRVVGQACEALRDELWRLVNDKVTAAVDIDDRCGAQRPMWLSAAHAVTAGTDGNHAAREMIDTQVNPYVDNDIRIDWLNAMRSARSSVTTAYEAATAAAISPPSPAFPIPGELGPRYFPDEPAAGPVAMGVASALASRPDAAPADAVSAASPPVGATSPPAAMRPDPPAASLDDLAGLPAGDALPGYWGLPGGLGAPGGVGLPGGAAGLGGLIPRIVDAIGGLLGSTGDGPAEPVDDIEPAAEQADETDGPDEPDADDSGAAEPASDASGAAEPDTPAQDVVADAPAGEAAGGQPMDDEPSTAAAMHPDPLAGGDAKTPCQIAADELPQAGR